MMEDRRITISCETCGYVGLWGSCYCSIEPVPLASAEALADLTRRVEACEAELARRAEAHIKLMRRYDPLSNDHEWATVEEAANINFPRCTCIKWLDKGAPTRKHNPYCKFPHNGQQGA